MMKYLQSQKLGVKFKIVSIYLYGSSPPENPTAPIEWFGETYPKLNPRHYLKSREIVRCFMSFVKDSGDVGEFYGSRVGSLQKEIARVQTVDENGRAVPILLPRFPSFNAKEGD